MASGDDHRLGRGTTGPLSRSPPTPRVGLLATCVGIGGDLLSGFDLVDIARACMRTRCSLSQRAPKRRTARLVSTDEVDGGFIPLAVRRVPQLGL